MIWKFRRFDFDQIRFHVFDNSITNAGRQKIDNGGMDFRRRREGPAFLAAVVNNFGDLIGQLFVNPAIGFGFQFTLGDGSSAAMRACAFSDRETSGQVGHLVDEFAVRIGDIKGLD